ncbi:MAG: hypothetical protein HQ558_03100 [Candidatus Omnitrophica bacterium]|nr:hypothetical protein [Candidatus Omnitrophota bacterium]
MAIIDIKASIEGTKEFMELWVKFHQSYKEAMGKTSITPDEEKAFLEAKSLIARKFQTLADSINIDRSTTDRTFDVINQILSLKSISTLSDQTLKKIENDWHESYISLNRLLGHLEAQKKMGVGKGGGKGIGKFFGTALSYLIFLALVALLVIYLMHILGILKTGQ